MKNRMLLIASVIALALATLGVGAVTAQPSSAAVYTADLAELNDSGVSGTATVVLDGTTMTVLSDVAGVAPALPHAQHLHGAADAEGVCPTAEADADGDGFVTVAEGAPSYGGIQVSLTTSGDTSGDSGLAVDRMPVTEDGAYDYVRTFEVSEDVADLAADLSYVVHGIDIDGSGEYDGDAPSSIDPDLPLEATIPAACGELSAEEAGDAYATELTALNDSGATSTATIVSDGIDLTVGISGDGFAPGLPHAQHLHADLSEGAEVVCPTPAADADGDGFITVAEGVPSYGGIQLSLTTEGDTSGDSGLAVDRMPVAADDGTIAYVRTIEGAPDELLQQLPEVAAVQHGIDIDGSGEYDGDAPSSIDPDLPLEATIPAVCGTFAQADEPGDTDREIGRVAGETRIQTAIQVSERAFPDGAPVVYIAAQDVNPDALVGGVLTDGPILLVPTSGDLPADVEAEIQRVDPDQVLALGGSATVPQDILVQAGNA